MMGLSLRPSTLVKGHPIGLGTIFLIEVWERFAYYGMRALLMLYMTKVFLFSDSKAYELYGAFTALVYATPVIGGLLADKLLGYRKATTLGALCMGLGYLTLALPIDAVDPEHWLFYSSLALIAIGNGLFKPNTASLLGALYEKNDTRRDAGFSIFYMGINLGAFFAPIVCGFVGETINYQLAFFITSLGLFAGLILFTRAQSVFGEKGLPEDVEKLQQSSFLGLSHFNTVLLGVMVCIPLIALLLQTEVTGKLLIFLGAPLSIYLAYLVFTSEPNDRGKIVGIITMMFLSTFFWACFEQAGSSLNLFADRNVQREITLSLGGFFSYSFTIPTSTLQAVNSLFILAFAPVISKVWLRLGAQGREPSTATKFALAFLFTAIAFFTLVFSAQFANEQGFTSLYFILGYYFMITIAELCISPVGLSMVTRLAPQKITAVLMGIWLLSFAYGNYLSGVLAKLASGAGETTTATTGLSSLATYTEAFYSIGMMALVIGIIMALLIPSMKRLMGEMKPQPLDSADAVARENRKPVTLP